MAGPGREATESVDDPGPARSGTRVGPTASAGPIAAMLAAVVATGVLPFLRFREFFLAGDSIAQWVPVSRRIGDLLLSGESHLMDPSLWRGGNFVAEARFGVWNPLVLLMNTTVLQLDDLAVVTLVVSLIYLVVAALGVFLLAREYGAAAWPSALAGAAVTSGGWLLWFDAAWWTPHLASFAFTPFVWLTARRTARGSSGPGWLVLAGLLCMTVGNPYSAVVIVVIVVAVAAEFSDPDIRRAGWTALLGALFAIGLVSLFVYLPFRQTSSVGFRSGALGNDESWAPGIGDFLLMSSPTATPFVRHFNREVLDFPAFYVGWFVLPLAPWLRWRTLASRRFVGLAVTAAVLLLLALGPSEFWFFRWPIRMLPYLCLPALVAVALAMSGGLRSDRWRLRSALTVGVVGIGAYLSWADVPDDLSWHLAGAAVVLAASSASVLAFRHAERSAIVAMMVASVAVLGLQVAWTPKNESFRHYGMPTSAATYGDRFGGTSDRNLVQIASYEAIPPDQRHPDGAYRDLALGSTLAIGGVESVSMYSGLGFTTHDVALCIRFNGSMCADAWNRLWVVPEGATVPLVDLLGADAVVVQRTLVETADATPPEGWRMDEVTDTVVRWRRTEAPRWPDGRLVDVVGPAEITDDRSAGAHRETVTMRRTGEGPVRLVFARLAWPGYEAQAAGRVLAVGGGDAGLVTVTVPADVGDGEIVLTWQPPFFRPSILSALLGILVGIAAQIHWLRQRRAGTSNEPDGEAPSPVDGA